MVVEGGPAVACVDRLRSHGLSRGGARVDPEPGDESVETGGHLREAGCGSNDLFGLGRHLLGGGADFFGGGAVLLADRRDRVHRRGDDGGCLSHAAGGVVGLGRNRRDRIRSFDDLVRGTADLAQRLEYLLNVLVAFGRGRSDFREGAGRLLGKYGSRLDFLRSFIHRGDRTVGFALDLSDQCGDLLRCPRGAFGQLADLVGHDGKALALLAGSGRFDGGVQRQQVGLLGDVVDRLDDRADLVGLGAEFAHALGGRLDGDLDPTHADRGFADRLDAVGKGRGDSLGADPHFYARTVGVGHRQGGSLDGFRGVIDALGRLAGSGADLRDHGRQFLGAGGSVGSGASLVGCTARDLRDGVGDLLSRRAGLVGRLVEFGAGSRDGLGLVADLGDYAGQVDPRDLV